MIIGEVTVPYVLIADAIVLLHLLWILFLVFGAFIGRRYRWVRMLHIAGVSFALVIQVFQWYCPLTYIEVWLRRMHDPSQAYRGSFIINYAQRLLYIELRSEVILVMTVLIVLISAWLYLRRPVGKG